MGLRLCHEPKANVVALYCSTSGFAFGHVFEGDYCEEEAEDFLEWCEAEYGIGREGDPRSWTAAEMETRFAEWFKASHDKEGNFIVEGDE